MSHLPPWVNKSLFSLSAITHFIFSLQFIHYLAYPHTHSLQHTEIVYHSQTAIFNKCKLYLTLSFSPSLLHPFISLSHTHQPVCSFCTRDSTNSFPQSHFKLSMPPFLAYFLSIHVCVYVRLLKQRNPH